jgi:hypothetical protein
VRGAVSVAIDPVVSDDAGPVVVEQPLALSAAKTATEARSRAGGRCIKRKPSTESRRHAPPDKHRAIKR